MVQPRWCIEWNITFCLPLPAALGARAPSASLGSHWTLFSWVNVTVSTLHPGKLTRLKTLASPGMQGGLAVLLGARTTHPLWRWNIRREEVNADNHSTAEDAKSQETASADLATFFLHSSKAATACWDLPQEIIILTYLNTPSWGGLPIVLTHNPALPQPSAPGMTLYGPKSP